MSQSSASRQRKSDNMASFIFYDTHDYEVPFVEEWEKKTGYTVKTVSEPLNDDTVAQAKGFDGITLMQTTSLGSEKVYAALESFGIKQISVRMVGVDMIDLKAAAAHHLTVTHVPVYSPRAIAEMGVTQAMYLLRHIGEYDQRAQKDADFSWPADLISDEIYTRTVGLIGTGNIGGATAQIYRALGARVIGFDVFENPALAPFVEFTDKETVLREADIISLHTPLIPSTKNMIGTKEFEMMKPNAILINQARGGLVDTKALIHALDTKEIAGAGLDTLADETTYYGHKVSPADVPEDYKNLAARPNVVVTPHVAFFTKTAVKNQVQIALNDALTLVNGGKTRNAIRGEF